MKNRFFIILLSTVILTSIGFSNPNEEETKAFRKQNAITKIHQNKNRIALVIGNNTYQTSPLSNAVADALAMKKFLENHGFKVIYLENGTTREMRNKIALFTDSITKDSISLVYYSGHGTQEKSRVHGVRNYLIPVDDKRIKRINDLDEFAISLDYILNPLKEKSNGLNIVMLDACRTSMRAFSKSRSSGLSATQAQGVYIAYATASNTTALDDSLFRKSFIKHASKKLKLIDIFEEVKMDVYEETKQNPFTSNGKRGAFYFTSQEESVTPIIQPIVPVPISTTKWITPTENVCKNNGGIINKNGICEAYWMQGKRICKASGGVLPSVGFFKKIIIDCGGIYNESWLSDDAGKNNDNEKYKSCYRRKGFNNKYYWSSYYKFGEVGYVTFSLGTVSKESMEGGASQQSYTILCIKSKDEKHSI